MKINIASRLVAPVLVGIAAPYVASCTLALPVAAVTYNATRDRQVRDLTATPERVPIGETVQLVLQDSSRVVGVLVGRSPMNAEGTAVDYLSVQAWREQRHVDFAQVSKVYLLTKPDPITTFVLGAAVGAAVDLALVLLAADRGWIALMP